MDSAVKHAIPKPSFASIAARAPPVKFSPTASKPNQEGGVSNGDKPESAHAIKNGIRPSPPDYRPKSMTQAELSRLVAKSISKSGNDLSEPNLAASNLASLRLDDEKTHLSSSSTKPASLDGKSVASMTTFAMDEKESLRPDDSASVKAAEEDDAFSGPASGAASSRVGSESGSKAFRDQFNEISERIGPATAHRGLQLDRRRIPGIEEETPQGTVAQVIPPPAVPVDIAGPDAVASNGGSFTFDYQEPDEKLLEALESPKDRLFLLRLEQDVIDFVRDSQASMIDLPPCNSFCRLLAHKLADYYALTHFVDNAVSAVRLYRTPYCRLPTPLSAIAAPVANIVDVNVVSQPAVKIMRRGGRGKNTDSGNVTGASSMVPSGAGSETGDDFLGSGMMSPTESAAGKDKASLTREEREAKYKETRERIFKGFEDSEVVEQPPSDETSNEVSRASSTSGKRRQKKTKNNNDGFEARSQFNAYYPSMQHPVTSGMPSCLPMNTYEQQGFVGQMGATPNYGQSFQSMSPMQAYDMSMHQNSMGNGYSMAYGPSMSQSPMHFGQQPQGQYYQPLQSGSVMGQQSPAMSSPSLSNIQPLSRPHSQMSDQPWPPGSYQSPYHSPRTQPGPFSVPHSQAQGMHIQNNVPPMSYPYGQLPPQHNMHGAHSQHPLPGSYNRQAFNPQTQAFVPANGVMPLQTGQYMSSPGGSAQYGFRPNMPPLNGMVSYTQSNYMIPLPMPRSNNIPINTTRKTSPRKDHSQTPAQSTLSKWATPANLPPKPPPPETPGSLSGLSLPNMTSGQGMPSFQNGTYTQASTNH